MNRLFYTPAPTPEIIITGTGRHKKHPRLLSLRHWSLKTALPVLLFIPFLMQTVNGQVSDNQDDKQHKHSPHRASIYSAVLPGLGQVYNKKYWKVPVIYAGFGGLFYITRENTREYRKFLEAYRYVVNQDSVPINNDYVDRYNEQQLLQGKNVYRRNVEIGYIIAGAWYILNIIDASVDAHLFYYDVSENLSMKLEPVLLSSPLAARPVNGLSLTLKF
jgi:hypothetical protein